MCIWNLFSGPDSQKKKENILSEENGGEKSEKSQISVLLKKSTLDFKYAIFRLSNGVIIY